MHPVAIANTRTTSTAATDPPSPGLCTIVLWLCCAVVVSVMLAAVVLWLCCAVVVSEMLAVVPVSGCVIGKYLL